jgi:hypothetical protein
MMMTILHPFASGSGGTASWSMPTLFIGPGVCMKTAPVSSSPLLPDSTPRASRASARNVTNATPRLPPRPFFWGVAPAPPMHADGPWLLWHTQCRLT